MANGITVVNGQGDRSPFSSSRIVGDMIRGGASSATAVAHANSLQNIFQAVGAHAVTTSAIRYGLGELAVNPGSPDVAAIARAALSPGMSVMATQSGPGLSGAGRVVQYALLESACCDAGGYGKGVRLSVSVGVSTSEQGRNGPGLRRVSLWPLDASGNFALVPTPSPWDLSPKELEDTKTGSASHVFSCCFLCVCLASGHNARFSVFMEDGSGNASTQTIGVSITGDQFSKCCDGVGGFH